MKKIPITAFIVVGIIALAVFFMTLVHALWWAPELDVYVPEDATSTPARYVSPEELPARLVVPALAIDAAVQAVGVNAKGNMGVPSNFTDVAWYKYGTAPGERGSAVIDGHVDNGLSLAGVFKHLNDIKVGDDVYVTRHNGEQIHFRVIAKESYNYKMVPLDRVFNQANGAYLNLITCEGNWVKNEKTYDQRLVIYTKLVS